MQTHNSKGSALVLIMAALPIVISTFLLVFSLSGFVQTDLALKYECRTGGQNGQKKVGPLLTKLLSLNPRAKLLKTQYIITTAQFSAAIATFNFPAAAAAKSRLSAIKSQRMNLEAQQKQLISQSNLYLLQNHQRTQAQIKKSASSMNNILLKINLNSVRGSAPKLAVRPDSSDTAPTYSLKEDFQNEQALAHQWHYQATVRAPFSNFLPGSFTFEKACAVTLEKEYTKWSPKIIKGKFLLKSVW